MSDLDKKIQKSQPDLVQSVLEAQEKKNVERVDVLITNALKQLKISRFKPDQTTCLSLIYLARVSPKSFSQSSSLKELLKTHLRRDNGPANIKTATKNDFILPVLTANILLACSDSPEVRAIILKKVEQWLNSNQKITENVQHLLALLCVRCQGDAQTVQTLIEMRQHWYPCLDIASSTGCRVAVDLCNGIRKLLHDVGNCQSLIDNLAFLLKHDNDTMGLSRDVSRFILDRPITLKSMLDNRDSGKELKSVLLLLFNKLSEQLKFITKKAEDIQSPIYLRLSTTSQVVAIERSIVEAILTLLASIGIEAEDKDNSNHSELLKCWLLDVTSRTDAILYTDSELTKAFHLPTKLRNMLIQSECDSLIDIGLHLATPSQLAELLQQFGTSHTTVGRIFVRLNKLEFDDLNKLGIKDPPYFNEMLDFLAEIGIEGATNFKDRLVGAEVKEENVKPLTKIKLEV